MAHYLPPMCIDLGHAVVLVLTLSLAAQHYVTTITYSWLLVTTESLDISCMLMGKCDALMKDADILDRFHFSCVPFECCLIPRK